MRRFGKFSCTRSIRSQRLLFVVDRDDEHARPFRACGAQEIEPRRIAVEGFQAEAAQRFHLFRIGIQHRRADAIRPQQTRHDMSETPHPGEDDRVVVLIDFIRIAHRQDAAETRLHEAIVDRHEQRRGRHGERHGGDEQVRHVAGEDAVLRGESAEDKRELAALREREGKEKTLRRLEVTDPAHRQQHDELQAPAHPRPAAPPCSGCAAMSAKSMPAPTEMKNRPRSKPLNGSISVSS